MIETGICCIIDLCPFKVDGVCVVDKTDRIFLSHLGYADIYSIQYLFFFVLFEVFNDVTF